MTPRPMLLPVQPEGIPAELRALDRWLGWKLKWNGKRWTKVPHVADAPAYLASSTDPNTWRPFDVALAAYEDGKVDGIGITLGDGLAGVDLDAILEDDVLPPAAQATVNLLNSYTEYSPTKCGIHILTKGTLPEGGRKNGHVEMYCSGRFFTVTGHRLPQTPATVEPRQAQLDELHKKVFGPVPTAKPNGRPTAPPPTLDLPDHDILERARRAKNGAKFSALWAGDTSGYPTHSEADLALCSMLAFWTQDPMQLDRLFRASGLRRAKWDTKRQGSTYGHDTISKALSTTTEHYNPRGDDQRHEVRRKDDAHIDAQHRHARQTEVPVEDHQQPAEDDGAEDHQQASSPGEADTADTLVPPPTAPLAVARRLVLSAYQRGGSLTLRQHRKNLYSWNGRCWPEIESDDVRSTVYQWLEHAKYEHPKEGPTPFAPTRRKIDDVLDALRACVLLDSRLEAPSWSAHPAPPYAAREIVAMANGLLHVPTRTLLSHTPDFFTHHALPFGFEPTADEPERWMTFLRELWEADDSSIHTLQEVFGYLLAGDTRQQKIFLIVGPKRGGKGTVARVLTGLLGHENVAAPTLASLSTNFGLAPLVGKPLAVVSDARLSNKADSKIVVERLLSISGEDSLTADRKFKDAWTGRFPTRFLILTNELPRLSDASGALASRFVLFVLTKSFYGAENPNLTNELLTEAPAIFNWALDGFDRLMARGYFVTPPSGVEAIQQLEDLSSPISAFLRDKCVVGPMFEVEVEKLWSTWKTWCEHDNHGLGTKALFSRDLRAAVPTIKTSRPRTEDDRRPRHYLGIALKEDV